MVTGWRRCRENLGATDELTRKKLYNEAIANSVWSGYASGIPDVDAHANLDGDTSLAPGDTKVVAEERSDFDPSEVATEVHAPIPEVRLPLPHLVVTEERSDFDPSEVAASVEQVIEELQDDIPEHARKHIEASFLHNFWTEEGGAQQEVLKGLSPNAAAFLRYCRHVDLPSCTSVRPQSTSVTSAEIKRAFRISNRTTNRHA
jgi:hypothetical protein